MTQHVSPLRHGAGGGTGGLRGISRGRTDHRSSHGRNEVTDIIPFDEFGSLADLDFCANGAFAGEAEVLSAPELDDLTDTDNLTALRLVSGDDVDPPRRRTMELSGVPARRGKHRHQPSGVVRGRLLIAAMAAGAAAAAGHAATHPSATATAQAAQTTSDSVVDDQAATTASRGMQMITVKQAANVVVHNEELAKGVAFAQERAEREARLQRPLFVLPTRGIFTSNFGYRWGVLHGGIDIANSIGTPILAASDGVVIEAGASAGYGMLVKIRHYDGTVTLYGHVNSTTVSAGERVMAGDQIATMGNRGYSTGPHLHFEVLVGGSHRVDPAPWLSQRGISFA